MSHRTDHAEAPAVGQVWEFTPNGNRFEVAGVDPAIQGVWLRNVRTGGEGFGRFPSFRQGGHYVLVAKGGA